MIRRWVSCRNPRLSWLLASMTVLAIVGGIGVHRLRCQDAEPRSSRRSQNQPLPAEPTIQLCQATTPCLRGVDSTWCTEDGEPRWRDARPIPFQPYLQGEYVGPARIQHVPEYRIRVDDQLEFVYRLTRASLGKPYELNIGDQVRVEVLADMAIDRTLEIQPDETIVLPYIGAVRAARLNVTELRDLLTEKYEPLYPGTTVTVTPTKVNTQLEDFRTAVVVFAGSGGQVRQARVTPEGTIALPAIGSVPAQGLTLDELSYEVDERYAQVVRGLEVTPVLVMRAPRYIYVLGDVRNPGRYSLEQPTNVMGGIALAGGWANGGNLRQVIVFRRTDDWHTIATKLDIRGSLYGHRPSPADNIDLRDSDVIVVPKSGLKAVDEAVELLFTRGLYAVLPGTTGFRPFTLSTID